MRMKGPGQWLGQLHLAPGDLAAATRQQCCAVHARRPARAATCAAAGVTVDGGTACQAAADSDAGESATFSISSRGAWQGDRTGRARRGSVLALARRELRRGRARASATTAAGRGRQATLLRGVWREVCEEVPGGGSGAMPGGSEGTSGCGGGS